jgi:hypothetical protein
MDLCIHSLIRPHGRSAQLVKHRDNFTFLPIPKVQYFVLMEVNWKNGIPRLLWVI